MTTPKRPGRPKNPDSKRSKGVDRHTTPRKTFHAPTHLFDALEKYLAAQRPAVSESATLRTALEEFLERRGFLRNSKDN